MTLYFITSNKRKFEEAKKIIPNIEHLELDLLEIQELDAKKIIEEKLNEAMKKHAGELVCEDTSVYINCLNGFPGPLIKWVLESIGHIGLAELVLKYKNHSATAKTIIGYSNGKEIKFFEGILEGEIVMPKGDIENSDNYAASSSEFSNGQFPKRQNIIKEIIHRDFGWDKIFKPKGFMENSGNCIIYCPESPMDISERSDLINRNIHNKTLGEMSIEEKNKISMRMQAFVKLKNYLESD